MLPVGVGDGVGDGGDGGDGVGVLPPHPKSYQVIKLSRLFSWMKCVQRCQAVQ